MNNLKLQFRRIHMILLNCNFGLFLPVVTVENTSIVDHRPFARFGVEIAKNSVELRTGTKNT